MLRTLGVAAVALVAGIGLGLAKDAGADQPKPLATLTSKTPVSCLLALESAWKTINTQPPGPDQHKAEFDAEYAKCLEVR